ncbi:MAG: hypothetical protein R2710_16140 [Acidimicrobiales bacterium]
MNLGSLPGIGWTADDIPDQQGRVAIVTGGNSGSASRRRRHWPRPAHESPRGSNLGRRVRWCRGDRSQPRPGASVSVARVDLSSVATVRAAPTSSSPIWTASIS